MSEINEYKPGTFCWTELLTSDAEGAKTFYKNLFGWNPVDMPIPEGGIYTTLQIDGKDAAALHQMAKEQMETQGIPPHWLSYVSVTSADEAASKAQSLNGTVLMQPFDVMDVGRMAVLQDPSGGVMAVWQPGKHIGATIGGGLPGTVSWRELATRDTKAAGDFYSGVFGWNTTEQVMSPELTYTIFGSDGEQAGGMWPMDEQMAGVPPHWMPYFAVEDCDATAAKAVELGGSVIVPPSDIPNVGRFAMLKDPQGAAFSILKMAM